MSHLSVPDLRHTAGHHHLVGAPRGDLTTTTDPHPKYGGDSHA
jgi:hypothetical protein